MEMETRATASKRIKRTSGEKSELFMETRILEKCKSKRLSLVGCHGNVIFMDLKREHKSIIAADCLFHLLGKRNAAEVGRKVFRSESRQDWDENGLERYYSYPASFPCTPVPMNKTVAGIQHVHIWIPDTPG
jgi:hypothetical protein